MSYKFALSAGILVVLAAAAPHLGGIVSPIGRADAAAPVRIIATTTEAPAFVAPAPVAVPHADAAPVYGASDAPAEVHGDPKTPDFDPEHPPADMGEPG